MTPEELRQWRMSHGLTQKQLAEALAISQKNIENWEMARTGFPAYLPLALETVERRIKEAG